MAKRNTTESGTLPGTPARTRMVKPKSDTVIELESKLKEAKKLTNLLEAIPTLSRWGIDQVKAVVEKRNGEISLAGKIDQ